MGAVDGDVGITVGIVVGFAVGVKSVEQKKLIRNYNDGTRQVNR